MRDGQVVTFLETWDGFVSGGIFENVPRSSSNGLTASLSAVLETRPVPRRYWLSAKAAAGILRRAEKRGKELPERLRTALESLAAISSTPTSMDSAAL